MAKSAKNLTKKNKKVLVWGPTGAGKTTLFTTFPGKKLLFVFDPAGLDPIAGLDIDYEWYPPDSLLGVLATKKGATDPKAPKRIEPVAYTNFENSLSDHMANGFENYDCIGFASLTVLQLIVMDRILYLNGRYGRVPELSDYNIVGVTIINLLRSAFRVEGKIFYVEAHNDLVQDEVSKRIQNQLDITKNVRRILPRMCSDMWVCSVDSDEKGSDYRLQTAPDRMFPSVKNSMSLKTFMNVTLDMSKDREGQGIGRYL